MPEATKPGEPQITMQCMEVWGGNQAVDNGVIMQGLDAWVYSRPYRDESAGGDIHYVSSCATGRITRILVADVSGHGSEVAEVAVALRTLMRRFVNFVDQGRLVRGLNTEFASLAEMGRFATAVVATFWAPTDDLVVSNAGHPRPMWYRAKSRAWELLADDGERPEGLANIPLGIAEPTRYDELSIRLSPGDLVLIYTDSLVEASDAAGRQLGEAGLLRVLGGLDPRKPEVLIPSLLAAVEAHSGGITPADDVTALLLRPNALKPKASLVSGLVTTGRLIKGLMRSVLLVGRPLGWPQATLANIAGPFFRRFNRVGVERAGGGKGGGRGGRGGRGGG